MALKDVYAIPVTNLKVGGYIGGLFWQTIPDNAKINDEFNRLSEELNFNSGIHRSGDVSQIGLYSKVRGKGEQSYSLAVAIVNSVLERHNEQNFLFAGKTPDDNWVYIACRDGVILPTGDIIGTEDEIKERFYSDLSISEWGKAFVPASWGEQSDTQFIDIEQLITFDKASLDKSAKIDLYVRDPGQAKRTFMSVFILFAVAYSAYLGYQYWEEKKRIEQIELDRTARMNISMNEVLPPPWENMADPLGFTSNCVKILSSEPVLPGSWTLASSYCDEVNATTTWSKPVYSSISMLKAVVPDAVFTLSGDTATRLIPSNHGKGKTGDELEDRVFVTEGMVNCMQEIGQSLTLAEVPPPVVQPRPDGSMPPSPVWIVYNWSVSTSLSPVGIMSLLNRDGLRVKKIERTIDKGLIQWKIEGIQYAK